MKSLKHGIKSIARFYTDGFRGMTWGRQLWLLILLKLFILFAVLRVFFFKPVLSGKDDAHKSEFVGTMLTAPAHGAGADTASITGTETKTIQP